MYFLLIINAGTTGRMKKSNCSWLFKSSSGKSEKLDQKYPDKSRRIQKLLSELSEMEKSGEKDIDKMAGCFGKIMEEIFAWKQDVWEDTLRRMGFFLANLFIFWMHTMMWKRI